MATATCTINGHAGYNSGWSPTGAGNYSSVGSLACYAGKGRYYCMKFTLPSVQGDLSNSTLTFRLNMLRTSSTGGTSNTLHYAITTVGRGNEDSGQSVSITGSLLSSTHNFTGLSYSDNAQQTFTTAPVSLQSGKTYYLWLYNGNLVKLYTTSSSYGVTLNYTANTSCGAPTSITLKSGAAINKAPSGYFTIQWSGAKSGVNNNISGYTVYYRVGSKPTTSSYTGKVEISTSSSSGSITIHMSNASRGSTVYCGIVTKGTAGSSWYSSISTSGGLFVVNRLPSAPKVVSESGNVSSSEGGTFVLQITPGTDPDSGDSVETLCSIGNGWQPLSTYLTSEGSNRYSFTIGPNISEPIPWDKKYISFISKDKYEYGDSTTTFRWSENIKPEIIEIVEVFQTLEGNKSNPAYELTRLGTLEANINKTVTDYEWYIAIGSDAINLSNYKVFGTEMAYLIHDFSTLASSSDSYLNQILGKFFRFGLKVSDGYDESEIKWSDNIYQMPYNPVGVTFSGVFNNPVSNSNISGASSVQFESGLRLKFTNPNISPGYCNIKAITPIYTIDDGSLNLSTVKGNTTSGISQSLGLYITPPRNSKVKVGIRLTDSGDKNTDVFWNTNFFRAELPIISSSATINFDGPLENNIITIRPYTNTSPLSIKFVKGVSDNGLRYTIQAYISEKDFTKNLLENYDSPSDPSGTNLPSGVTKGTSSSDSEEFIFSANYLENFFKDNSLKDNSNDSVWNRDYNNVIYRVYVKDYFENSSNTISSSITSVKFIEKPTFNESDDIKLGIDHIKSSTTLDGATWIENFTGDASTINNERMVNPDESILFKFLKPNDYNNDIVEYRLYIWRRDDKPNITLNENYKQPSNYTLLTSFNDSSLTEIANSGGYYYYRYTVPIISNNQFIIFYLEAIDSKSMISNKIYSETYLVRSRKQNPSIILNSATVESDFKISIKYNLTDIGGSLFANSQYVYFRENDPTNSYPNFERTFTNLTYNKKAKLIIEYCLDGNFSNTIESNYKTETIELSNSQDFKYSNLLSEQLVYSSAIPENFQSSKLYIRLTVMLSTGFGNTTNEADYDYVNGISNIFVYYASIPTLAYRKNSLGVNSRTLLDDDVLVISDFDEKKKIRLVGSSSDGLKNFTIIIDLSNGTIDGAIMNGGNWDSEEGISNFVLNDEAQFYVIGGGNE